MSGWYLKAVLLGERDITDVPTEFAADDAGRVRVVLTNRASELSGTVTDDKGEPVKFCNVVLFSEDRTAWFGASSRVRQRVDFDIADYDLSFKSRFGVSDGNTHRSHARVQTDVSANAAFGFSGGFEWLGERGGSTFITSGPDAAPTPIERGVLGIFGEARWNAGDRATVTGGVRGERITRDALPGDPLAFTPRPAFPEETINSVNPKIAASFRVADDTRLRGALGTGIRPPDAFDIAFTDNSGLKPERSALPGDLRISPATRTTRSR